MFSKKPKKSLAPQRIHLLFPTPEETKANPDIAFTDHLMILTQVPLPDGTFLNIISLNILGGLSCSGIHYPNTRETEETITERYGRMVQGLNKAIQKHQVDILAFQEATPKYIMPVLKKQLKGNWGIIKDEKPGLVTCFNNNNWISLTTSVDDATRIRKLRLLNIQNTELLVDFHNIWGNFDEFPLSLENQCETALTTSTAHVAIIMGDTNSRLAPLDDNERNLTTGAIPLIFNDANGVAPGMQLPDYPDGGFYRGQDGVIHQLTIHVLDFVTGDIFVDRRKANEMNYWPGYRMIMCLDKQLKEKIAIHDQTVFDYQTLMRATIENENIVVRLASDCFNHKAVAIGFPKDNQKTPPDKRLDGLVTFIVDNLQNTKGFETRILKSNCFNEASTYFTCFFMPKEQAHLLHAAINSAIHLLPVLNVLSEADNKPLTLEWEICEADKQEKPVVALAQQGLYAVEANPEKKSATLFKTHAKDKLVADIITKLVAGCQFYIGPNPLIKHDGIIRAESFNHLFQSTKASKTCLAIAALALLNPDTGTKGLFGGSSKGTGLVKALKAKVSLQEIQTLEEVMKDSALHPDKLKNIQNAIIDSATEGKYNVQVELTDMDILSFSRELAVKHHISW